MAKAKAKKVDLAAALVVPKGMTLLVSKEDFSQLASFENEPVLETPTEFEVKVVLAKWHGHDRTIVRHFLTRIGAELYCEAVEKAGGKVKQQPKEIQVMEPDNA
jgi:hypothetical protein